MTAPQQNVPHIQQQVSQATSADISTKSTRLPDDVAKDLSKLKAKYVDNVRRYVKSQNRLEKSTSISDFLAQPDNANKYPSGVKPFTSSPTFLQLDEPWASTVSGPYDITIQIPQCSTRRQAMAIMHHKYTTVLKTIECEAAESHLDSTCQLASKQALRESLQASLREASVQDQAAGLGLDAALTHSIPDGAVDKYVEQFYAHAVKTVKGELDEQALKLKKTKDEQEQVKRDLLKSDPRKLLSLAIQQELQSQQVHSNMDIDPGSEDRPSPALPQHDSSSMFVEAISGRGQVQIHLIIVKKTGNPRGAPWGRN